MRTKRWISFLLCLLLCGALLAVTAASAHAAEGQCGDNLYWSFDSDTGILTITGSGAMKNFTRPAEAPWHKYLYYKYVREIVLSNDLTSIGSYAFSYCTGVTSITIPDSVTSIGGWAFYGSTGLTSITIPDSVTSIGDFAFKECEDLTSVTLGNSVTSIGDYAFFGCMGLASITIPDSVTRIRSFTFDGCTGLTSVTIGNGVTSIGEFAFFGCGITSITIPDSVTSIGNSAFAYCKGLTSVTLGTSVRSIGEIAFYNCTGLTSVQYDGTAQLRKNINVVLDGNDALLNATWHYWVPVSIAMGPLPQVDCAGGAEFTISGGELQVYYGKKNGADYYETEPLTASMVSGYDPAVIGKQTLTVTFGGKTTSFEVTVGHVPGDPIQENEVPATCTNEGSHDEVTYCAVCCVELKRERKNDPVSHILVHHDAKAATCTDIGWDAYDTCKRCDYTTYMQVPALGHLEVVDAAVAPTCTDTGLTEGKHCSRCGKVMAAQNVVPALGHDLVHHNGKEPTDTESGWEAYDTCNRCNYTTYMKIPSLKLQKFVGHWVFTKSADGFSAESLNRIMTLDFYEGGSVRFRTNDSSVSLNWTISGSEVYLKAGNKTYFTLVYSNEMLFMVWDSATFIFEKAPIIFNRPKDTTACEGKDAAFLVKASGTNMAYQWYSRSTPDSAWTAVKNGTKATLTVLAKRDLDGSQYFCKIINTVGTADTNAVTLTVTMAPPVITTQPKDVSVKNGEQATFTVKATGDSKIEYQWYSRPNAKADWTLVNGAMKDTYTVTGTRDNNGWQFRCRVKNEGGEVYSNAATLTVTLPAPPTIKTQPKSAKVKSGSKAKFAVKAKEKDVTYQWFSRASAKDEWKEMKGETKATLTVVGTGANNGWQYRCRLRNKAGGEVYSNIATLTVTLQKPVIKTQPKSLSVKSGKKAKFSVKATGKNITYQWFTRADAKSAWKPVPGSNKNTLNVVASKANNGSQYYCCLKNADGDATSVTVTLTVATEKPIIKTQPKSLTVKSGAKAKFTVKASGKNLKYTWYSRPNANGEWKVMAGQTKNSLTIVASKANSGTQYYCKVQNLDGSVDSAVVTLTVTPEAPTIKTQPKDAKVKIGGKAKFKVKATGKNVTYQWYYRTSADGEWILLKGATKAEYSFVATADKIGWQFRCLAKNADGQVYSKVATLRQK